MAKVTCAALSSASYIAPPCLLQPPVASELLRINASATFCAAAATIVGGLKARQGGTA